MQLSLLMALLSLVMGISELCVFLGVCVGGVQKRPEESQKSQPCLTLTTEAHPYD